MSGQVAFFTFWIGMALMCAEVGKGRRPISIPTLRASISTQIGLCLVLTFLWISLSAAEPGFLSKFNLNSLGRSASVDVVVGFAQMVVLASGGMNLSVGAIGVCAVMANGYFLQVLGLPIYAGSIATLGLGGLLGLLNGVAIAKTNVSSFIVTLASASLFGGGMLIVNKGVPFDGLPPSISAFGRMDIGPVPVLVPIALAIGVLLHILFAHTALGRQILAVGGSIRVAEMSGIEVNHIVMVVHVLSGVLAAAAALILTARTGAAMPAAAGNDWLLPSFLGPVIGGTLLSGGRISVTGAILGALLVATMRSGLLIMQVGSFWLQFFLGIFLLASVMFERSRSQFVSRGRT